MHLGVISPPVPGHIHPFGALGRELIARGHRVSVLHMPDLEPLAKAQGVEFIPVGQSDFPLGSLAGSIAGQARLHGMRALRFLIGEICKTTEMICRDAPRAIGTHGIEALLVDQTEPAGGSIAEYLGIPFITVCNALALNRYPETPPPFTGWSYRPGLFAELRNRAGYAAADLLLRPVRRIVDGYRRKWNLAPLHNNEESFSKIAQISQQFAAFDFPHRESPAEFHYVGPLRRAAIAPAPFPWNSLDGRPLVYASLGTLQTGKERVFRCFAEACRDLNVQLVITHGGGLPPDTSFPGNPLVVSWAPQLEVLAYARLTLTHAGFNTVLDSLSCGVPLVTVPIAYEQPGIASRVRWTGAGEVLPFHRLDARGLRSMVERVLGTPSYAACAKKLQESIREAGGVRKAADLIETGVGRMSRSDALKGAGVRAAFAGRIKSQ